MKKKKDKVQMKFREVGLRRHPELYTKGTEVMVNAVVSNLEKEIEMWDAAEEIDELLKDFTIPQRFFIWHYVNALKGMDTLEEIKWMEWLKFRAYYSRQKDIDREIEDSGVQQ